MSQIEFKNFEIKQIDVNDTSNEMFIEGYASNFGNKDEMQMTFIPEAMDLLPCSDIVAKGAFKKTIAERKGRIAFCKNHDIDDAKGKIVELKEDDNGLFCRIRISDAENELKIKIKEGIYSDIMDWIPCSDIVVKGAFKKTIAERKGRIAFCKNHDIDDAKGKIVELKEDDNK